MATKIEWTNETWNIITGCNKASEGCQHCFAESMHRRLTAMRQKKYKEPFNKVVFHKEELKRIISGINKKVFINSMSDTFNESITKKQIQQILCACENQPHIFQILTKRAERLPIIEHYPLNVWLGVTVEMAKYKKRIEYLKETDATIKFLSCEPLLDDLGDLDLEGIDWVIAGGESGRNARPVHPDWVRNIKKQCEKYHVPFFFKQWGEWVQGSQADYDLIKDKFTIHQGLGVILNVPINQKFQAYKLGKKYTGCKLDGKEYKQMPQKKRCEL